MVWTTHAYTKCNIHTYIAIDRDITDCRNVAQRHRWQCWQRFIHTFYMYTKVYTYKRCACTRRCTHYNYNTSAYNPDVWWGWGWHLTSTGEQRHIQQYCKYAMVYANIFKAHRGTWSTSSTLSEIAKGYTQIHTNLQINQCCVQIRLFWRCAMLLMYMQVYTIVLQVREGTGAHAKVHINKGHKTTTQLHVSRVWICVFANTSEYHPDEYRCRCTQCVVCNKDDLT